MSAERRAREALVRKASEIREEPVPLEAIRQRIDRRVAASRIASAIVAFGVAGLAIAVLISSFSGGSPQPSPQRLASAAVVATYPVAGAPSAVTASNGSAWVASVTDANCASAESDLSELVDGQTRQVGSLSLVVTALDAYEGELWVGGYSCTDDGSDYTAIVTSIDPSDGRVLAEEQLGSGEIWDLAATASTVWVAFDPNEGHGSSRVVGLDRSDGSVVGEASLPSSVRHLGVDPAGTVWGVSLVNGSQADNRALFRLDPGLDVQWIVPSNGAAVMGGMAFGPESIWVAGVVPPTGDVDGETVALQFNLTASPQLLAEAQVASSVLQPVGVDQSGALWYVGGANRAKLLNLDAPGAGDSEIELAEHHDLLTAFDRERFVAWVVDVKAGMVTAIQISTP